MRELGFETEIGAVFVIVPVGAEEPVIGASVGPALAARGWSVLAR